MVSNPGFAQDSALRWYGLEGPLADQLERGVYGNTQKDPISKSLFIEIPVYHRL